MEQQFEEVIDIPLAQVTATDEFLSVFDGVGLLSTSTEACKGCGGKFFFAVSLAT